MKEQIVSVGIDIGTSTMEIVFSHITLENLATSFRIPDIRIVDKTIIYRSDVYFTPLLSNTELDAKQIASIVKREYEKAGMNPKMVQTGAVIITGDTARKVNAKNILHHISAYAGDFVVATAGPSLESILAGKGSGAQTYSENHPGKIANFDIGGGTTNIAIFENGKLIDVDCYDIGGRLIRFKKGTSQVEYIYPKIQKLAQEIGIKVDIGTVLTKNQAMAIVDVMADGIIEYLKPKGKGRLYYELSTNEKEGEHKWDIDYVSFSGGVGKLIYQSQASLWNEYSDVGVLLAEAIQRKILHLRQKVVEAAETIGATVVGAGNHTMEVSGSTIFITDKSVLPLQNIPIVEVELEEDSDLFVKKMRDRIDWMLGDEKQQNVAIAPKTKGRMTFKETCVLAENIIAGAKRLLEEGQMLIIIVKEDFGKVLGQSIKVRLKSSHQIICLDGIFAETGDYIDIGMPVGVGDALPVIIKTLAFSY